MVQNLEKSYTFVSMKKLWIFLWVHYKIGLFWGVISIHFRAFKGQDTEWEYFWGPKFQIFWGMPAIPDFLGGGGGGGKQ